MDDEVWAVIEEFPNYRISNHGNVINAKRGILMCTSVSNYGHAKISLSEGGSRHTRSIALLVAQAFVEAPDILCDSVVVLNGNLDDVRASNLVWRPAWFAWQYARQLRCIPPHHYETLPVLNETTGQTYESIVDAGMTEGLLFSDIWMSTYTGKQVYPHRYTFKIV